MNRRDPVPYQAADATQTHRVIVDPQHLAGETEPEFHLSEWLSVLRRRWHSVAAVTGLVLLGAVVMYLLTPPVYRATTVLHVERPNAVMTGSDMVLGWDPDWASFYPTQVRLLKSRGLAELVVTRLRLAENPAFNPGEASESGSSQPGSVPTAADDDAALGALAYRVLSGLRVELVSDTRLMEISYTASQPRLAALIANGVADAYIDWGVEQRRETMGRTSSFIASQIASLKAEIQEKEAQLQAYSLRTDIINLDPGQNETLVRIETLNREYTAAVSERISREARYQELVDTPDDVLIESLSDPLLAQLRLDQLRLEREYATRLTVYKPEWPAMQQLAAQIEGGKQDLAEMERDVLSKARDTARADYQGALRREQSLQEELVHQREEAMDLNSASVEYNNLKVEVSTRRALLDDLLRKQSKAGVAGQVQDVRTTNISVVDRALVPGSPFRPALRLNLQLGLLIGLLGGIGAAFLLEHLDRRIRVPDDVERATGFPVLAVIPNAFPEKGRPRASASDPSKPAPDAPARSGPIELLPHTGPRLPISEAYRSLRTALLLSKADGLRSLVVSSAIPGEGKTATASNLAVVLAQLDRKVLLVDADLRRPRLHEVFGVSNRVGIVNFLTGSLEPDAIMVPTSVSGLDLTVSGPTPPNPSELLSAQRLSTFLDRAQELYDHVIIDSPPILPVTDAILLGINVDGLLLCVGAGTVQRNELTLCRDRLQHADVKVLGTALNRYLHHYGTDQQYGVYAKYYAADPDPASD